MEIFGLQDKKYLTNLYLNNEKIRRAIQFANEYHCGQTRKSIDKEPFIVHCLNVGDILASLDCNDEVIISGILHDVIEDTAVSKNYLSDIFGEDVANLVNYVTEQDKSKSWKERFIDYINVLNKAPDAAKCISAADKIDNMNSIVDSLKRNYNIFQNMKGSPQMQLEKFNNVFEIVKDSIPCKLKEMYKISLNNYINAIKTNS